MKKAIFLCFSFLAFCTFTTIAQEIPEGYSQSYVVIAEHSTDYDMLYEQMEALSKVTGAEIDLMGRVYNPKEKIIALPEDYEDDLYAGGYYPRRYMGKSLSIEHLSYYTGESPKGQETLILVVGILGEKEADELLQKILPHAKNAYVLKALIYIGCMH